MFPQLSLRRQQVGDKLNEWTVFNDKYKELCEWLTRMESKVSQNGDVSIEEMIEKLRKVGVLEQTSLAVCSLLLIACTFLIMSCLVICGELKVSVFSVTKEDLCGEVSTVTEAESFS